MKFSSPKISPWWRFLSLLAFGITMYVMYRDYGIPSVNDYIMTIVVALVAGIVLVLYVKRDKLKSPPYEVENDTLYIHYGGGEIDTYPLSHFAGKIGVIRYFFEECIIAPGYWRYNGKIPIGFVNKKERIRFIEYLRERVENVQ